MRIADMRACWILCACAALTAGGAFASNDESTITIAAGSNLPTRVRTNLDDVESCVLVTPRDEAIQFIPEDLSGDKYALDEPIILYGCKVTIKNLDENDNGTWELYYTKGGVRQRSHFYHVIVTSQESQEPVARGEEEVNAVPSKIRITEGSDLYVRLEKHTALFDTCVLSGPTRNTAERDENFIDACGFIVRNVNSADAGIWEISYGTDIKYTAHIRVDVREKFNSLEDEFVWDKNAPVNETIGPEDTVFCRVEDPSGRLVFHGFGRCNIVLDQVRSDHAGVWKSTIGTAGRVLTETLEFTVNVATASKAEVVTSVVSEKPSVMLSCQVASEHNVTACKFRDPSGKVLLASQGVGEDRYNFHGSGVSLHSEVSGHECGLRITNPVVADLGLWRCAMETKTEIFYGFLTAVCPWAMMDPAVAAAVVSEPTLTAEAEFMKAVAGDVVTMSCSVQSAIRYCYFRAQNGTIFNVSPGGSEWFEYAGTGLDAGECGIRFPALQVTDSGRWSCHVGFHDHSEPEQRAQMELHVEDQMVANQYHLGDGFDTLVILARVHSQQSLEYCRFVRMDGEGFTSENLPSGYHDHSLLTLGICEIRIPHPNILEQHPWAVVAKIAGHDSELARTTQHTITTPGEHHLVEKSGYNFMIMWSMVLMIALALFLVGVLLGPKRNRKWTYGRASSIRNSFRASMAKAPLPAEVKPPTPA